jgi:hypothetical protein
MQYQNIADLIPLQWNVLYPKLKREAVDSSSGMFAG